MERINEQIKRWIVWLSRQCCTEYRGDGDRDELADDNRNKTSAPR